MTLNDRERALCDWIADRHDDLVKQLAAHVAIPTGQSFRPGLDEYRGLLCDRLRDLGASIELQPGEPRPWWLDSDRQSSVESHDEEPLPVVLAKRKVQDGQPSVLIAGHLDTVHDPHGSFREMTLQSDKRYATGPGVVDMKGGILVALIALEALAERGIDLNWSVILNSDEETGSFQSAARLRDAAADHHLGIAIEPALADGSLAIERMGSGQFMFEVFGQSAHVGREFEKGVSAVTQLGELLVTLGATADPDMGRIVNVGPLKGGTVTNAVPDYAACWGNVRYNDPAVGEELGRVIDALQTNDDAMPRIVVHRNWNRPAKPLNDAVQQFAEITRRAAEDLGQQLPFAKTGGVCDGNILQDAGLPTLDTLGVRGGNLHRPDEFIELASLVERSQLLAVLLARIASGDVDMPRTSVRAVDPG